jgi:ACT domain-containing protein
MMMSVDLSKTKEKLDTVKAALADMGKKEGLSISVMHEDVFQAMHRI